jgi:hypothetical protein
MDVQKEISIKTLRKTNIFVSVPKVTDERKEQDPEPDPLVKGTDPRIRIRIRTKMSRIQNIGGNRVDFLIIFLCSTLLHVSTLKFHRVCVCWN